MKQKTIKKKLGVLFFLGFLCMIPKTVKASNESYGSVISKIETLESCANAYISENKSQEDTSTLVYSYIKKTDSDFITYANKQTSSIKTLQTISDIKVNNYFISFSYLISLLEKNKTDEWSNRIDRVLNKASTTSIASAYSTGKANLRLTKDFITEMDAYNISRIKSNGVAERFYHYYNGRTRSTAVKDFVNYIASTKSLNKTEFRKSVYSGLEDYVSFRSIEQLTGVSNAFADYLYAEIPGATLSDIKVSAGNKIIDIGDTKTMHVSYYPSNSKYETATYSSNRTDIATVNSHGKITGINEGTAIITIKARNVKKQISVQVVKGVESILIQKKKTEYQVGKKFTLKADVSPKDATIKEVHWTSSDSNVATVDQAGNVVTNGPGYVTISATSYNGISTSEEFKIYQKMTKIEIPNSTTLIMGISQKIKYKILPTGITDDKVRFESEDSNIISIDNTGLMTPVKNGTTKIYIYSIADKKVYAYGEVTVITKMKDIIPNKNQSYYLTRLDKFKYDTYPLTTSNKKLKYKMKENPYASVDQNGTILTKKIGMTDIDVESTDGTHVKKTVPIYIEQMINSISVKKKIEMKKGQKFRLNYTVVPITATKKQFTITPDSDNIIVSDGNLIEAIGYGTTKLTLRSNDPRKASANCYVIVKRPFWHYLLLGLGGIIGLGLLIYAWKKKGHHVKFSFTVLKKKFIKLLDLQ